MCLCGLAACSDPSLGPPASEDDLQVAYEAALWQLLDFFFLSYDEMERGSFPEVRPAQSHASQLMRLCLSDLKH